VDAPSGTEVLCACLGLIQRDSNVNTAGFEAPFVLRYLLLNDAVSGWVKQPPDCGTVRGKRYRQKWP
jgi:hypothetical protein